MTSHQILNKHTIIDVFCSPSMRDCSEKYFIKQILPTAQRLLDELLSSQKAAINTVRGAPGTFVIIGFHLIL
jgi:hypothetical protein